MKLTRWMTPLALALLAAGPALAHHSFAMFDMSKTKTLSGTVRTFEWSNPHSWVWLYVTDDKGVQQVWGLEGTGPGELTRHGWSRTSLKPGDKISVEIHPLRDGRTGGSLGKITFADGHTLGGAAPVQQKPADQ